MLKNTKLKRFSNNYNWYLSKFKEGAMEYLHFILSIPKTEPN